MFTRLLASTALLSVAAAASPALLNRNANSRSALNCEFQDPKTFRETIDGELQERPVDESLGAKSFYSARFVLKGFKGFPADTLLIITSSSAPGRVYQGPLIAEFAVKAPEPTFLGKGRDNFRFILARPATRQVCVAEHDAAFWSREHRVVIELLAARELDRNGLPVAFRVSLQL